MHPEIGEKEATIYNIADVANEARNCFHKCHKYSELAPYCDFFTSLKPERTEEKPNITIKDTGMYKSDMSINIIYLLQIENGCSLYKDCLKNVMNVLGMEEISESECADPESYKKWGENLGSKLLLPYIAPCMIVEEKLKE